MHEQGSGVGGSTMLRTRPNTIKRGKVLGDYIVRGAKIKCSRGDGYDVVNLPLCHGVYSGDEPLINVKDMETHKNICNGFGVCTTSDGEKKICKEEMLFSYEWINRKKVRFHIDGEQAVTTNSFTMCSRHGGEISFIDSGQTAMYYSRSDISRKSVDVDSLNDEVINNINSLMKGKKHLKDLRRQQLEVGSDYKKEQSLNERIKKTEEHMVYLAESSPIRPEILLALKRNTEDASNKTQYMRPEEVMLANMINYSANGVTVVDRKRGPTVAEAAILAKHVYKIEDIDINEEGSVLVENGNGWQLFKTHVSNSKTLEIGFYKKEHLDGSVDYAIVNAGSSMPHEEYLDWVNNSLQIANKSPDMEESIIITSDYVLDELNGNRHITFIGHSKGGAEAAANALVNNKDAILFNPAWVNYEVYSTYRDEYSGEMKSYVVDGDILDNVQTFAINKIHVPVIVEPENTTMLPVQSIFTPVNHSMESVINGIEEQEKRATLIEKWGLKK